jgi:ATP-dependent helicase/nuclease subunit B
MDGAEILVASSAQARVERAASFLRGLPADSPALVLAPTLPAATTLCLAALEKGAVRFGWFKRTFGMLASELSVPELAARGVSPVHGLGDEALCMRVAHRLIAEHALVRYRAVADRPGFVRALSATFRELRLSGARPDMLVAHDPDLAALLTAYERELSEAGLVDRRGVLDAALLALRAAPPLPAGVSLVALDLTLWHAAESELFAALYARAPSAVITVAHGDERTREELARVLPGLRITHDLPVPRSDLERLRTRLFATTSAAPASPLAEPADSTAHSGHVELLSSPGEGREAVEVVRRILGAAEQGTRFDRMAVVLRATRTYRGVVEEAFARAGVPAHFADGVERPHPEGRAFLALLECAREQLSARAFAEYLSLGVMVRASEEQGEEKPSLPSPRKWERLLVDAAVMHGRARWERRLRGLGETLKQEAALLEHDDPRRETLARDGEQLCALLAFATPVLDALTLLPEGKTWGEWLTRLTALAQLALAEPASVCELLSELLPLSPLGPVRLHDVIRVLERRLPTRLVRSEGPAVGKVLVGSVDDLLGQHFDVVFVLGLAEKLFPPRVTEDPLLPDVVRRAISPRLACVDDRARRERALVLRARGAACGRWRAARLRRALAACPPWRRGAHGLSRARAACARHRRCRVRPVGARYAAARHGRGPARRGRLPAARQRSSRARVALPGPALDARQVHRGRRPGAL